MSFLRRLLPYNNYNVEVVVNVNVTPQRKYIVNTQVRAKSRSEARELAKNAVKDKIEILIDRVKIVK